jgi:hypothetical protein
MSKYSFNGKSIYNDPKLISSIHYLKVLTRKKETTCKDCLNGVACINKYKGWHPLDNMQLCSNQLWGEMLVRVQHLTEATMFLDR